MFKIGDLVVLTEDSPDENEELSKGDKGEVLDVIRNRNLLLVRWDKSTTRAHSNDHLIHDYYLTEHERNPDEYNDTYYDHIRHLWYVYPHQLKLHFAIEFRKKKRSETQLEYKIAHKIAELDYKWKEKQDAKTRNLSL